MEDGIWKMEKIKSEIRSAKYDPPVGGQITEIQNQKHIQKSEKLKRIFEN